MFWPAVRADPQEVQESSTALWAAERKPGRTTSAEGSDAQQLHEVRALQINKRKCELQWPRGVGMGIGIGIGKVSEWNASSSWPLACPVYCVRSFLTGASIVLCDCACDSKQIESLDQRFDAHRSSAA